MYPDSVFNTPISSFQYPVPVPTVDPDDPDTLVQFCLAAEWVAYVAGCLKQLWLQSTWDTDDPDVLALAQQRAMTLVSMLAQASEGCGLIAPSILCLSGTFADLDYDFVDQGGGVCPSTWVVGTGWESCPDVPNNRDFLAIGRMLTGSTSITSYSFRASVSGMPSTFLCHVNWYQGGILQRTDTTTQLLASEVFMSSSTPVNADEVRIDVSRSLGGSQTVIMDNFEICYLGLFPLAGKDTWRHVIDFTVSDGMFAEWTTFLISGSDGNYSPGTGWQDGDGEVGASNNWFRSVLIQRLFDARITEVTMTFDRSGLSTNQPHTDLFTLITDGTGATNLAVQDFTASQNGTDLTLTWTGDMTTDGLVLQAVSAYFDTAGALTGSVLIKSVTISGIGFDPLA